jgi:hypothetical protein
VFDSIERDSFILEVIFSLQNHQNEICWIQSHDRGLSNKHIITAVLLPNMGLVCWTFDI